MKLHPSMGSQVDLLPEGGECNEIHLQVWALLSSLFSKTASIERRRETRYPFPYLFQLIPVGDDDITPVAKAIVVAGKHMSHFGLGFYHAEPIPYRRAIVSIESGNGKSVAFLMDLNWCRFTRQGWYESGGRFLEAVTAPLEKPA